MFTLVQVTQSAMFLRARCGVLLFSPYLKRKPTATVNITGSVIKTSLSACDLGDILDQCSTMSTHVSNLCKSTSFVLKLIGNIRQYLDQPSTENRIHAFVSSLFV